MSTRSQRKSKTLPLLHSHRQAPLKRGWKHSEPSTSRWTLAHAAYQAGCQERDGSVRAPDVPQRDSRDNSSARGRTLPNATTTRPCCAASTRSPPTRSMEGMRDRPTMDRRPLVPASRVHVRSTEPRPMPLRVTATHPARSVSTSQELRRGTTPPSPRPFPPNMIATWNAEKIVGNFARPAPFFPSLPPCPCPWPPVFAARNSEFHHCGFGRGLWKWALRAAHMGLLAVVQPAVLGARVRRCVGAPAREKSCLLAGGHAVPRVRGALVRRHVEDPRRRLAARRVDGGRSANGGQERLSLPVRRRRVQGLARRPGGRAAGCGTRSGRELGSHGDGKATRRAGASHELRDLWERRRQSSCEVPPQHRQHDSS